MVARGQGWRGVHAAPAMRGRCRPVSSCGLPARATGTVMVPALMAMRAGLACAAPAGRRRVARSCCTGGAARPGRGLFIRR